MKEETIKLSQENKLDRVRRSWKPSSYYFEENANIPCDMAEKPSQDKTRQDKTRQDKTRLRQDKIRQAKIR